MKSERSRELLSRLGEELSEVLKRVLNIRFIDSNDFGLFKEIQRNELVREYLGGRVEVALIQKKFKQYLRAESIGEYHFAVEQNDFRYGIISLSKHTDIDCLELSFQFLPQFWGKGIAFESCCKVIDYAFENLGVLKLVCETQSENKRSRNLIEILGMKKISCIERFGAEQTIYELNEVIK
jgi:ribosomal-protein-alanine N-acetyltransferase